MHNRRQRGRVVHAAPLRPRPAVLHPETPEIVPPATEFERVPRHGEGVRHERFWQNGDGGAKCGGVGREDFQVLRRRLDGKDAALERGQVGEEERGGADVGAGVDDDRRAVRRQPVAHGGDKGKVIGAVDLRRRRRGCARERTWCSARRAVRTTDE